MAWQLLRHYQQWGALNTVADPIPAAFNENDQVKYAGLYVAQEMAASCGRGVSYAARGNGCFQFLHDGKRRCSSCHSLGGASHPPGLPRMALDRSLQLFENIFHRWALMVAAAARGGRGGGGGGGGVVLSVMSRGAGWPDVARRGLTPRVEKPSESGA